MLGPDCRRGGDKKTHLLTYSTRTPSSSRRCPQLCLTCNNCMCFPHTFQDNPNGFLPIHYNTQREHPPVSRSGQKVGYIKLVTASTSITRPRDRTPVIIRPSLPISSRNQILLLAQSQNGKTGSFIKLIELVLQDKYRP
jgi:hypothetical protein